MRRVVLLSLAAAGCATGYGEAASGTVDVGVLAGAPHLGDVRFERTLLSVGGLELVPAETEAPAEEDHGHSHLVRAAMPAKARLALVELSPHEQTLGSTTTKAGPQEELHVELVPAGADAGDAAGCAVFAQAAAILGAEEVPLRICVPGAVEVHVSIVLEVEHDAHVPLPLMFDYAELLHDVDVASLVRQGGGGIAIDEVNNPAAFAQIRSNLSAAFVQIFPDAS